MFCCLNMDLFVELWYNNYLGGDSNMFVIKSIKIVDKSKEILNVFFCNDTIKEYYSKNYTTLILGENGVGKSFLLKSIIDIFLFLENAKSLKRKPKYQYESFSIEYRIENDDYYICRENGTKIVARKNGLDINYKEVQLPNKVLALSFMVNDKFQFSKDDENDMYVYHGVRSSTNSTYTSSISRNITFDLIKVIEKNYHKEIAEIFSVLHFDPIIEFEYKYEDDNKNKKVYVKKVDFNSFDKVEFGHYNKWFCPTVYFRKNNKRITFDSCSSGEKHLLFAYMGILSRIRDNSLILIDEPEISLHPEWQIKYISNLNKLFGKYKNCHFILASHSHYFVSELQGESSAIVVLKNDFDAMNSSPKSELIPYDTYAWSAENIIYNVFGIRTTRNYYFESDLSHLIMSLESFDDTVEKRDAIKGQIEKLQKYVYDLNDPLKKLLEEAEDKIK